MATIDQELGSRLQLLRDWNFRCGVFPFSNTFPLAYHFKHYTRSSSAPGPAEIFLWDWEDVGSIRSIMSRGREVGPIVSYLQRKQRDDLNDNPHDHPGRWGFRKIS